MATAVVSPLADPQQIQGNILRPFGGRHQAFLFLSFGNNRPGARAWLGGVAERVAGTDDVGTARVGLGIDPARSLLNVGLTATGLVLLHPEVAGHLVGHDAFWRGALGTRLDDSGRLTTAPALLGDIGAGDPANWAIGGPGGPPIDALLTVAADDERMLVSAVEREIEAATGARLTVLSLSGTEGDPRVQRAEMLRNDAGQRVEHFGFADGMSQPGIRGFHDSDRARPGSPMIAAGEFILGCAGERRPQTWLPRPSPAPWMWGGSFQVFRRLRQDVAGWWARMAETSAAGGTPEDAAARALGRRLDGAPLAAADPDEPNDFHYGDDQAGSRTPLYAHIRKMNPREDGVFRDRSHKMLRRGIPFGPRFDRAAPDHERGLIFNAYVASIEDQFEFVQRRWANDPGFPASTLAKYGRVPGGGPRIDGLDPVLGDGPDAARNRLGTTVAEEIPKPAFGGFVTTTGAVYAFAPAIPALRLLAGDARLDAPAFVTA